MRLSRNSRERLANTLAAAYAEGLVGETTLSHRLGVLFGQPVIDPKRLVGDLTLRAERQADRWRPRAVFDTLRQRVTSRVARPRDAGSLLLSLDWSAETHDDLLVGRDAGVCDVVINDITVSRCHARLCYRAGSWIIKDLQSTNGTVLNGERIGRCQLRPGDELFLGDQRVAVD